VNSGLKAVWAVRNLRILVLARFISNLGNGLAPVAVSFGVLDLPGGNGKTLSLAKLGFAIRVVIDYHVDRMSV